MPIDDDGKSTTTMAFSLFGYRILLTMRQSGILASVVGGKTQKGFRLSPRRYDAIRGRRPRSSLGHHVDSSRFIIPPPPPPTRSCASTSSPLSLSAFLSRFPLP
jgi:hypothetical protein